MNEELPYLFKNEMPEAALKIAGNCSEQSLAFTASDV